MIIKSLQLQNFRSFRKQEFEFDGKTTVILGRNTAGKTNTLEAIYLLSSGKSFRAVRETEMIREGEDLTRVSAETLVKPSNLNHDEEARLEVVVLRNEQGRGSKRLFVNKVARRLYGYAGVFKVVLFGPWDLSLVTESPSIRRRFLDALLSQADREYRRSLLSYEKGVRQRNRVLERIREGEASRSQLIFWNQLLIKTGEYISGAREGFIEFLNSSPFLGNEEFEVEYDKSAISEGRLEQYATEEVLAASTLVGPHRDDLVFKKKKEGKMWNLASFGSRGEQRMAVLWIKLAELSYIDKLTGERPVLLLDDIFSELDEEHHEIVIGTIDKQQTIITTAEERDVEQWKGVQVIRL